MNIKDIDKNIGKAFSMIHDKFDKVLKKTDKNQEAITKSLDNIEDGIKKSVGDIKIPEQKDYTEIFETIKNSIKEPKDYTVILNAIKNSIKEPENYSTVLEEISGKLENDKLKDDLQKLAKTEDLEAVTEYLRAILEKPLPSLEKFTSKDGKRIKVEVDRAGGGGTTGTYNASDERINPATEEKQDDIISELQDIVENQEVSTDIEGTGNVTVGTTEVEIVFSGTTTSIHIQADNSNTGIVYIGKTGVGNDGTNFAWKLEGGDEVTVKYDDSVNALYARSDTASQTINAVAIL